MSLLFALIYAPIFYFAFPDLVAFGLFVTGLVLGMIFLWLDELNFYKYYSAADEQVQLITRSPLFLIAYFPILFFIIFSTTFTFGIGFVLGIGLQIFYEMFRLRSNPESFMMRFYAHGKNPLSIREMTNIIYGFCAIYIALSAVLFFSYA